MNKAIRNNMAGDEPDSLKPGTITFNGINMKLLVQHQMSLNDMNKIFQKQFPFLKLKLCRSDSSTTQMYYAGETSALNIGETKQIQNTLPAVIDYSPADTVEEFEQLLNRKLRLPIKVFRKNNGQWVDTKQTKFLSLNVQNSLGGVQFQEHYNDYTLFL